MKNKKVLLIMVLTFIMAFALLGCSNEAEMPEETEMAEETEMTEEATEEKEEMEENKEDEMVEEETEEAETQELTLTLDELKMYDGTNGNPAYVAYDGVIYDVTGNSNWSTGSHGGNMVGTDITDKLNSAPHGTSKLSQLEAVGKIVE